MTTASAEKAPIVLSKAFLPVGIVTSMLLGTAAFVWQLSGLHHTIEMRGVETAYSLDSLSNAVKRNTAQLEALSVKLDGNVSNIDSRFTAHEKSIGHEGMVAAVKLWIERFREKNPSIDVPDLWGQ